MKKKNKRSFWRLECQPEKKKTVEEPSTYEKRQCVF